MTRSRYALAGGWLVVLILVATLIPALAQAAPLDQEPTPVPDDERARADALFNEGADLLFSAGDYERALTEFREARELYHALGELEMEADALTGAGLAYSHLGQPEEALAAQQEALDLAREAGSLRVEGDALLNIATVHRALGQHEQALDYYQRSLALQTEVGNRRGEGVALNNIGVFLEELGQYEQALGYYQQALAIYQEIGDRVEEGTTLNNIGAIYKNLGRYRQALDYFQQALVIRQKTGDRARGATALNNIGAVYDDLGRYEQSLNYYQQSLAILREIGNRAFEGAALNNIGMVYNNLGQYEQALNYYQQALAIEQEISDRRREGMTLSNIGLTYNNIGQYEQALDYLQKSLVILQDVGARKEEGTTLNNIGLVYDSLERYEQALVYHQQSFTIQQEIGHQAGKGATLANIGFVYERQGDTDQAINLYRQAIDVIESIQSEIQIEELRASFAVKRVPVYERLVNLLWEEGKPEDAFNYAEQARARAFLDQLAGGAIDFRAGADAALLARERSLDGQIAARRAQLVTYRNRPRDQWDTDAIATVQAELTNLEADYEALLTELKLRSPEVAELVSVDVASLADVQALLDPNTTLVEYFVTEERALAFIITHDTFETIALEVGREDIARAITNFRDFANLDDPHPDSLQQLHEWLIAPLQPTLTTPTFGIVPHGVLHYLPFATLTDGERYLSDDYVLFTLPSASVLRFIQEKRKAETGTLLALGNPTTTELLPALRFAEQEVEAIADLYGTQRLVDAEATESAVWSQAKEARVLHLAAHGEYNPFNPLFSAIHLAADDQHDGRLEVHEVYGLDLTGATNLVVLSACQTQLGKLSAGDEIVGLNRAFLYAGTPSVVASLWSVDDAATAQLMERFHTYLRAGLGKAEALRQAQIEVRAEYPHPYFWSAFVVTGDPGEVTGKVMVGAPSPTETVVPEPAQESEERRLCIGAALPVGLVVLAGIGRGRTLWRRRRNHEREREQ